jgi:hypothetical protein
MLRQAQHEDSSGLHPELVEGQYVRICLMDYYLAQVKKNQPNLFDTLSNIAQTVSPTALAKSDEKNRGREEHRHLRMWTSDEARAPVHDLGWKAATTILEVRHFGTRKEGAYDEYH